MEKTNWYSDPHQMTAVEVGFTRSAQIQCEKNICVYALLFTEDAAVRATKIGTAHFFFAETYLLIITACIEALELTASTGGQKRCGTVFFFFLTCSQDRWMLIHGVVLMSVVQSKEVNSPDY